MRSTTTVSVQQVGSNTYRVNAKRGRSALTGRFVTKSSAASRSAGSQTAKPKGK